MDEFCFVNSDDCRIELIITAETIREATELAARMSKGWLFCGKGRKESKYAPSEPCMKGEK